MYTKAETPARNNMVLLIDDDPDLHWTTRRMLEEAGYTVLRGAGAGDALSLAQRHRPALVLLDVELPDGDGVEIARQIKCDPRLVGVFVVLMSGTHITPQDQADGLRNGLADGFLTRPFSKVDFLARVEAFLRIRSAQQALRVKNAELERFTATVKDYAIFMVDPDGLVASWNAGAEQIKGYLPEEIIGQHFSRFYSREDIEGGKPERELLIARSAGRFEEEGWRVRRDGSHFWANVVITALADETGALSGFTKIVRDITERTRAAEKLAEYRLLLQASIESQKDTILLSIDRDYRYLYFNKAHRDVMKFAYNADIEVGMNILECITSDSDKRAARENYARALEGESHSNVRIYGDVEFAHFESFFNPILDGSGRIIGATALARNISERVAAEEALRSSEGRLRLFIENAPAALAMFDQGMRYLKVSRRWLDDYGLAQRDLLGLSHYEVFPEIPEPWREAHRRGLSGEVVRGGADRFVRSDGSEQWISWEIIPWHDGRGAVGGIVIFTEDVTEAKTAEKALALSNRKLSDLLDSIQEHLYVLDRNWNFSYASRKFASMLGKQPEDFLGRNFWEVYPKTRGTIVEENLCAVMDNRETRRFEAPGNFLDAWFSITCFPATEGVGVLGMNITERKKAEEALKNSEERYRRLFEVESDSVMMLDLPSGRFIDANAAALRMYGYSKEEFLQLKPADLSAEPAATETFIPLRLHRKKNGTVFPVEIAGSYFEYQGRQVQVAAIRDIAERVKTEQSLRDLNQQLRTLSEHLQDVQERERTALARDFHDDIGQNLTVLKFDLEWIARRIPSELAGVLERMKEMDASVGELTASVQRIAADLRPPMLDNVGLPAAIEWHVAEFGKRTGLDCYVMVNDDISLLDQTRATAVMRIIQEGLTNVARHARATEVNVSLCKNGADLILEIADNGRGITPEQVASEKSYGVMGMQERARICQGRLEIASSPGLGTTLVLIFPREAGGLQP